MKIYKTFGIGLLSIIIAGGISLTQATTPSFIKVQGFLSDKSGGTPVPANGPFNMIFDLYDAQTLGTLVASAGPILVTVTNGLYEAPVPFPSTAFITGSVRWVEITVELETLSPRVQIGSVPYAHQAELLDGMEGANLEESLEIDADIAAHSAIADAHVSHAPLEESAEIDADIAVHGAAIDPHGVYVKKTGDTMVGSLNFLNSTSPMLNIFSSGSNNPERPVIAHSSSFPTWGLKYRDTDDHMIFQGNGNPAMSIDLFNGEVGIGISIPTVALDVNGRISSTLPIAGQWAPNSSTSATATEFVVWDLQSYNTDPSIFGFVAGAADIQIKKAGFYLITANVLKGVLSAGETATFRVERASSLGGLQELVCRAFHTSAGSWAQVNCSGMAFFNANDRVRLFDDQATSQIFGNTGGFTQMTIQKMN